MLHRGVLDEELGEFGHDLLSEGESEEALETDYDSDIQTMLNDENSIPRLYRSNREAKQKERSDFSLSPPDVRATGQGARFISRQTASHTPLGWKFCTMNMTAFSTQHPAIFELGCHVCGLQETRLTEAGQTWARGVMREQNWNIVFGQPLDALRSAWEARPGGVAIGSGARCRAAEGTASLGTRESFARHWTLCQSPRRLWKRRSGGPRGLPLWARWSRGHLRKNASK